MAAFCYDHRHDLQGNPELLLAALGALMPLALVILVPILTATVARLFGWT